MATASTARTKRTQAPRSKTPKKAAAPALSAELRHGMIAEAAYLRAAARGFAGGDAVADWLESEREVDALLSRSDG